MMKIFLLQILKVKSFKQKTKSSLGFTLLELLVSMLIASAIIVAMLSFLGSVLDTDRKEQAKAESQDEIQSALNYIADDVQEAIYIYDADGLEALATHSALPTNCGLNTTCTPVLVFWKRHLYDRLETIGTLQVKDLTGYNSEGGDQYVYALVAYYLVKEPSASTWSNAARIARWELKNGVPLSICSANAALPTPITCPPGQTRPNDTTQYSVLPDPGFELFESPGSGKTLAQAMNSWKSNPTITQAYSNPFNVLIDFVDDTAYVPAQDDGIVGNSPVEIPARPNSSLVLGANTLKINTDCDNASFGVGNTNPVSIANPLGQATQRVPDVFTTTNLSSFYACVNASRVTARVYIRGSALARLRPDAVSTSPLRTANAQNSVYFPTASIRVNGRAALIPDQ